MTTTVQQLLDQIAPMVQEIDPNGNYWFTGLWTVPELISYTNTVCRDFVLRSQIIKLIAPVASVTGQRLYDDPSYVMQMDRIAFSNNPLYRTNRYMLDRENLKWRTLPGQPKQYHQDQLPTKTFETDRAPTSNMTGSGYQAMGLYGTLRFMMHAVTTVSDAAITATLYALTSATAVWTSANVGQQVAVAGAGPGGAALVTTIATFVSTHSVTTTAAASTTVTGAVAAWAPSGFYSATLPGVGEGGVFRYSLGTPAINSVLPLDRPYAGTLRQMLSGVTNFEVLATRLVDTVHDTDDLLRVPDWTVPYIKMGVLWKMLEKEGEGQDLPRSQYCKARYMGGVDLFVRLMSARKNKIPTVGATQ